MNWVAVDLGASTIKVSVLDKSNKPVRLSYPMGDYATTLLSSVVVVTEDKKVIMGDYASQLGVSNPNMRVRDRLHSVHKSLIAKAIFETIKQASVRHYNDSNIGIVLLYNNTVDLELKSIAEIVFNEVKTIQAGEVLKRIISPDSNLVLVADFGESAFRVTLQEKTKWYQNANSTLGFSSFDMLSLIDCDNASSHSSIEIALLGQMMQRIKIMANNGGEVVLPNNISAKGNSLSSSFEQKMTTFLYQCFEECTKALKTSSKTWENVDEVVFIGGGAHSNIIDTIFEKYMQSQNCTIVSYNSKNRGFDAQYATSNCAILAPELKEVKGVVVEL